MAWDSKVRKGSRRISTGNAHLVSVGASTSEASGSMARPAKPRRSGVTGTRPVWRNRENRARRRQKTAKRHRLWQVYQLFDFTLSLYWTEMEWCKKWKWWYFPSERSLGKSRRRPSWGEGRVERVRDQWEAIFSVQDTTNTRIKQLWGSKNADQLQSSLESDQRMASSMWGPLSETNKQTNKSYVIWCVLLAHPYDHKQLLIYSRHWGNIC